MPEQWVPHGACSAGGLHLWRREVLSGAKASVRFSVFGWRAAAKSCKQPQARKVMVLRAHMQTPPRKEKKPAVRGSEPEYFLAEQLVTSEIDCCSNWPKWAGICSQETGIKSSWPHDASILCLGQPQRQIVRESRPLCRQGASEL